MVILPRKNPKIYQYASMIWAPEEKGIYSISALATDNVGEKTLSPPVTVMVYDGYVDSSVAQDDSLFEVFLPYNEDSIIRPVAQDVKEAEAVITSVSRVVTATAVTTVQEMETLIQILKQGST